ncbi:MAG: hypothetical protein A2201_03680 [Alicyclobacillus sp. RIFOXYA1_FULL_53_8]|nr:MAG: hypothetical protein A2201_03680 [Alicyclobacillus sp. RIFOXYA1_FULL_53_8]
MRRKETSIGGNKLLSALICSEHIHDKRRMGALDLDRETCTFHHKGTFILLTDKHPNILKIQIIFMER